MMSLDGAKLAEVKKPDLFKDPVHFSHLKNFALSPAHYRASVFEVFEATRAMRVGTIVHEIVLGAHRTKPCILYDGAERKGNVWKDFERVAKAKSPKCEIVTAAEWADAKPIADAILSDPVARQFIEGTRREVPLQWTSGGILCETDGIDVVGLGFIGDVKRTSCTEPGGFARHAAKNMWHCQLAHYEEAANANGIDTSKGLFLLGVEPEPPYACTVMKLTEDTIAQGRKSCVKWLEALRVARENDHWPSYTQTVVPFDLPPWMSGEGSGDE